MVDQGLKPAHGSVRPSRGSVCRYSAYEDQGSNVIVPVRRSLRNKDRYTEDSLVDLSRQTYVLQSEVTIDNALLYAP